MENLSPRSIAFKLNSNLNIIWLFWNGNDFAYGRVFVFAYVSLPAELRYWLHFLPANFEFLFIRLVWFNSIFYFVFQHMMCEVLKMYIYFSLNKWNKNLSWADDLTFTQKEIVKLTSIWFRFCHVNIRCYIKVMH